MSFSIFQSSQSLLSFVYFIALELMSSFIFNSQIKEKSSKRNVFSNFFIAAFLKVSRKSMQLKRTYLRFQVQNCSLYIKKPQYLTNKLNQQYTFKILISLLCNLHISIDWGNVVLQQFERLQLRSVHHNIFIQIHVRKDVANFVIKYF